MGYVTANHWQMYHKNEKGYHNRAKLKTLS